MLCPLSILSQESVPHFLLLSICQRRSAAAPTKNWSILCTTAHYCWNSADFPGVSFKFCHGTQQDTKNENPITEKLSRAINQMELALHFASGVQLAIELFLHILGKMAHSWKWQSLTRSQMIFTEKHVCFPEGRWKSSDVSGVLAFKIMASETISFI